MTFAQANSTIFRAHFFPLKNSSENRIELLYSEKCNGTSLKMSQQTAKTYFRRKQFQFEEDRRCAGFAILPSKTFLKRFQLGDFAVQRPFSRIGKSSVLLILVWQTILQYDGKLFVAGRTDISKVDTMPLLSALYCININAII